MDLLYDPAACRGMTTQWMVMGKMKNQRLLIVDDEIDMLAGLQRVLAYELEAAHIEVSDKPLEVMALIRRQAFDLVLLDVRMPDMDGLELLQAIQQMDASPTVIMMTGYGDIETAVSAIKNGAYDFITKPFEITDLVRVLKKGLERSRLIGENLNLRRQVSEKAAFEQYMGESLPVRRLFETIKSLANTDYAVLIRGESGTGKELVARSIHAMSKRGQKRLVTVNCPAIPEHLLESELFGHHKGAFTGAVANHKGLFEEAHGSSLLLDEIADIPVSVQTKMLRTLQEQEIRPLGSSRGFQVDVRILATTNQNLEEKIRERTFREDLYYRLNVVSVRTPNLKEMREDIPLLVNYFALKVCKELEIPAKRISPAVVAQLASRQWPGNVRELQNFVRRLVVFSADEEIDEKGLQSVLRQVVHPSVSAAPEAPQVCHDYDTLEPYVLEKNRVVNAFTGTYIDKLLKKAGGNISQAAREAGLSRQALQKMLLRNGIDPADYR
jgi:DNA-binding NtrC family response regulator